MSLFNYYDDEVLIEEINSLLENQTYERRTIDYKLNLEINSDEQKKEFLADIVSFANTDGGIILYGISESDGFPIEIIGLKSDNKDVLKGKIESIIRDGISPRLNRLSVIELPLSENGLFILIIKIPKSFNSPHAVWFKKSSKFYARNSSHGKYQLDVNELKLHFLYSENLSQRIRDFRIERILNIINYEVPIPIENKPKFVMHIIPIASFLTNYSVPNNKFISLMHNPGPLHEYRKQYNYEGFIFHNQYDSSFQADQYIQVFRNGTLELVNTNFTDINEKENFIFHKKLESFYITNIPLMLNLLSFLDIGFPMIIFLSVLGIKNYKLYFQDRYSFLFNNNPIQKDNLLLPELFFEEQCAHELHKKLKLIFDPIWNAFGFPCSQNYDKDGNWKK